MDYIAIHECAAQVHPVTMAALMDVESSQNPYAIGVVGGRLVRQPKNKAEALATARALEQGGWNFSLGKSQVNRFNLAKYGLTYETAFDDCQNMRAGAAILKECYDRALPLYRDPQQALRASFSCYYSGNFRRGFVPDAKGKPSYVSKVLTAAAAVKVAAAPASLAIPLAGQNVQGLLPQPVPATPALVPQAQAAAPQMPAQKKPWTSGIPAKYDGFQFDDSPAPVLRDVVTTTAKDAPITDTVPQLDDATAPVVLRATAAPKTKLKSHGGVPTKYDGYQTQGDEDSDMREEYRVSKAGESAST